MGFVESKLIFEYKGELVEGFVLSRPNRFTIRAEVNSKPVSVYLPNPGRLSTVIAPLRKILCIPKEGAHRKTNLNAFAINTGNMWVTVDSSFANTLFELMVRKQLLFKNLSIYKRESPLPGYGRIDFVLKNLEDKNIYVEVKSCTHVEEGIAKFPDRPTDRGRRHLKILTRMALEGADCYVVFVVQRPDAVCFKPFTEVDPEFAQLLSQAIDSGVQLHAASTKFIPPSKIYLKKMGLPIEL